MESIENSATDSTGFVEAIEGCVDEYTEISSSMMSDKAQVFAGSARVIRLLSIISLVLAIILAIIMVIVSVLSCRKGK